MDTVDIPGARLRYRLQGAGPLLVLTGTPSGVAEFAAVADVLARERTVLTYDPRGTGASDGGYDDDSPDTRADDLAALLTALGLGPADVVGNSGGAVTGLALVTRYPDRVGTLIAHEPPLIALLPDAPALTAGVDEVVTLARADRIGAAWARFVPMVGYDPIPEPSIAPGSDPNGEYFLRSMIGPAPRYRPDLDALRAADVIVAVGEESAPHLLPPRASAALAEALGVEPVAVPGEHGGFGTHPESFARRVLELLSR